MSPKAGFRRLVRRQPLIAFVLLACGITWSFTIPFAWSWRTVTDGTLQPWQAVFFPGAPAGGPD